MRSSSAPPNSACDVRRRSFAKHLARPPARGSMNSSPNGGENPRAKRKSGVDFMAEAVLDASAVIALLFQEPGHDEVESQLAGAAISTVNVAEVADFLMRKGMSRDAAERAIRALELDMVA